jgi:hypothetical protein
MHLVFPMLKFYLNNFSLNITEEVGVVVGNAFGHFLKLPCLTLGQDTGFPD